MPWFVLSRLSPTLTLHPKVRAVATVRRHCEVEARGQGGAAIQRRSALPLVVATMGNFGLVALTNSVSLEVAAPTRRSLRRPHGSDISRFFPFAWRALEKRALRAHRFRRLASCLRATSNRSFSGRCAGWCSMSPGARVYPAFRCRRTIDRSPGPASPAAWRDPYPVRTSS
jgi:hypothetical protein